MKSLTDQPKTHIAGESFVSLSGVFLYCVGKHLCQIHHLDQCYCGRPWPAAYINIIQNTHQIQVLTKPLCCAQAIFY